MGILNPLKEKHCNDVDCVLQSLPSIEDTIKAFEECGEDCTQEKELAAAQKQYASDIKKRFNPLAE